MIFPCTALQCDDVAIVIDHYLVSVQRKYCLCQMLYNISLGHFSIWMALNRTQVSLFSKAYIYSLVLGSLWRDLLNFMLRDEFLFIVSHKFENTISMNQY